MKKVSIIVPVYNVEKYIKRCLDSLVNQTLEDIEIIVVNDGSPDNSQLIINKYKKQYPNKIKSYIKSNSGLSDTRNYGLKKAKAEYIAFLDSDDWVETNIYEKMYKKAIEGNFDMVVCDLKYAGIGAEKYVSSKFKKDLCDKQEIKESMIDIYPAVWNKLYDRKLFETNIRFKKDVWYEDVEFIHRLYPYINSIGVVKEPLIYYFQREGSITSTYNNKLYNYIDNLNGIIDFYKEKGFYDEYKKELEYVYIRYLFGTFMKNIIKTKDKSQYIKAYKMVTTNVRNNFKNYRKNKYFYCCGIKGLYLLSFNKISVIIISILYRIIQR